MTHPLDLPQELVDYIIDCLAAHYDPSLLGDRRILTTYTLVSPSWMPRASMYALNHIEIDSATLESFLEFARISTRIRGNTRVLLVDEGAQFTFNVDRGPEIIPDLHAIRAALPNLSRLEYWGSFARKFRDRPEPSLQISYLKLASVGHVSLIDSLRPFSHITTLDIRHGSTFPPISHNFDANGWGFDSFDGVGWEDAKTACMRELASVLPLPNLSVTHLILGSKSYHSSTVPLSWMSIRPSSITLLNATLLDLETLFAPLFLEIGEDVERLTLYPLDHEQNWVLSPDDRLRQRHLVLPVRAKLRTIELNVTCLKILTLGRPMLSQKNDPYEFNAMLNYLRLVTRHLRIVLCGVQLADALASIAKHTKEQPDGYIKLEELEFHILAGGNIPSLPDSLRTLDPLPDLQFVQAEVEATLPALLSKKTRVTFG